MIDVRTGLALTVAFITSCSFSGSSSGDSSSPGTPDASAADAPIIDAGIDAPGEVVFGPWSPPVAVQFVDPTLEMNPEFDDPQLLANGLLLYSVTQSGGERSYLGAFDGSQVTAPALIDDTAFPLSMTTPWISDDLLTFAFASGGQIFHASRNESGPDVLFGTPSIAWFTDLTNALDGLGWISADLLTLVYTTRDGGSQTDADIRVTTRATAGMPFPQGDLVDAVNTPVFDVAPKLAAGQNALVFNRRDDILAEETSELYLSRRDPGTGEFLTPSDELDSLNVTAINDSDPTISEDLSMIVFTSTRGSGTTPRKRIFVSTRSPLP